LFVFASSDSILTLLYPDEGFVVGLDAKVVKAGVISWPAPPEEICKGIFLRATKQANK
jgi:hypothetical protein